MTLKTWTTATNGDFATSTNWTGGEPGATDDAYLAADGGTAYTVTSSASATVNSIQTAANATLNFTGGTFTATAGSGTGANAGTINVGSGTTFAIGGSFTNSGTVSVNSYYGATLLLNTNTTLSGGGKVILSDISGYGQSNRLIGATAATVLTNVDNIISGDGQLGAGQLTLTNNAGGTIDANSTANQLIVNTGTNIITNAGKFEATGGATLLLQNTKIANSSTGIILGDGGTVHLQSANILGGLLKTANGGSIQTVDGGSILDGTSTHPLYVLGNVQIASGTSLTINGTINLTQKIGTVTTSGTISLESYYASTLIVGAKNAVINGSQIIMGDAGGNGQSNSIVGTYAAGKHPTVSGLSNNSLIVGDGTIGTNLRLTNGAKGVIDANNHSQALILATGNTNVAKSNIVVNSGLLESTTLDSTMSVAGLVIRSTVIANAKTGIIEANGVGTHVDLQTATITGGTLKTIGGGVIDTTDRGSVLDGTVNTVNNQGAVVINQGTSLTVKGTINNTGSIALNSYYNSQLIAGTNTTLTGGGTINMTDAGGIGQNNQIFGTTAATVLTNTNNTISGDGQLGAGQLTLVNQTAGVINASSSAQQLIINTGGSAVTNAGLIEATGTAGLLITGTNINNGTTGLVQAIGSHIDLTSATITGGTLKTASGGYVNTIDRGSVLDGTVNTVNNQGAVVINQGTSLTVKGTINNTGSIALNSYYNSQLIAGTNTTLTGGGTINMTDAGGIGQNNQIFGTTAATVLTNTNNTISGDGQLGAGQLTLVNQTAGVINASSSAQQLIINTGGSAVTNAGLIEATGTAGLLITGTNINNGTTGLVQAIGSHIDLTSATITGGTLKTASGGYVNTIDRGSVLDGTANTINDQATIVIGSNTSLTVKGTINNTGSIALNSYYNSQLIAGTNTTLTGGGTINMTDAGGIGQNNQIFGATAATVLTNTNNIISGDGQLGAGQLTLVNQTAGVINASSSAQQLVINTGGSAVTNAGLIEATGTAGLSISNGVSNTGNILANGGNVIVGGAITGAGTETLLSSNSIENAAASSNAVTFGAGASGKLKLDMAQLFTGTVAGFNSHNSLDLANIANSTTSLSYSGNATGGTLTVTDGTTTANIALQGNYTAATFAHNDDGAGHASITVAGSGLAARPANVSLFAQSVAAFAPQSAVDSGQSAIDASLAAYHPVLAVSRLAA